MPEPTSPAAETNAHPRDAALERAAWRGDAHAQATIWRRYLPLVRSRMTRTIGAHDGRGWNSAMWSPQVPSRTGKTYYWLIFSSSRDGKLFNQANLMSGGNVPTSQLSVTAVVDDGSGTPTTYPALYIWNQPSTYTWSLAFNGSNQSNHTPTWKIVDIPPATVIPK